MGAIDAGVVLLRGVEAVTEAVGVFRLGGFGGKVGTGESNGAERQPHLLQVGVGRGGSEGGTVGVSDHAGDALFRRFNGLRQLLRGGGFGGGGPRRQLTGEKGAGTVKFFNAMKGFGFISPDDSQQDVFAHFSAINGSGYRSLEENQRVEFEVGQGTKGPQAAGVIHTDFEKGFIRAETIAYDDYVAGNGEAGAREAGKFRVEGKTYEVKDGDVLHFRFNV